MADKRISTLSTAATLADGDVLVGNNGATTKKFTLGALKTYVFSKISTLVAASGLADADVMAGMQGTTAKKFALSDLATYFASKLFVFTDVLFYDGMTSPTIRFVADTASAVSTIPWVDNGGATNPTLGTGGYIRGRVRKIGKDVTLRFSIICGTNTVAFANTDLSSTVSTSKLSRATAITAVNGTYVTVSNLGATVIPASTQPDGSYIVVNVDAVNKTYQLSNDGTTPLVFTGANATNVHVTATVFNKGSGVFYRIGLPYNVTPNAQTDQAVIGTGHIFLKTGFFGFEAGNFKDVHFHVAQSVDASVCGIVVGSNLVSNNLNKNADGTDPAYSETNHTDVRTLNETSVLTSNTTQLYAGTTTAASGNAFTDAGANFGTDVLGKRVALGTYNGIVLRRVSSTQLDVGFAHGIASPAAYTIYRDDVTAVSHVVGTMREDLSGALKAQTGDNVGPAFPMNWTAGMRLIGIMNYETP